MMLWQEKAGARYMYYVLSLAWLLELIPPHPSLSLNVLSRVVIAEPTTPLQLKPKPFLSSAVIADTADIHAYRGHS